eukprot:COSAG01_NODE_19041_length_1034_cov_236.321925_2_plen_48_part_00
MNNWQSIVNVTHNHSSAVLGGTRSLHLAAMTDDAVILNGALREQSRS